MFQVFGLFVASTITCKRAARLTMPAACSLSSAVARSGTRSSVWSHALLAVPGAACPLTATSGLSCSCSQRSTAFLRCCCK